MINFCVINGELVENGSISIHDRGFTIGDGLFETIPIYSGRPFLLPEHFARMTVAAKVINLQLPCGSDEVAEAISDLVKKTGIERGDARLTVTRGEGPRGYASAGLVTPTWVVVVRRYTPLPGYIRDKGLVLARIAIEKSEKIPIYTIKSLSSLERTMMIDDAREQGADEAIVMTTAHNVSSGAAANIFWVSDGILYTPGPGCAILPGITRAAVIRLAGEMGIEMSEGAYPISALDEADELFITNSLLEIMPVRQVLGRSEYSASGAITRQIMEAYRAFLLG